MQLPASVVQHVPVYLYHDPRSPRPINRRQVLRQPLVLRATDRKIVLRAQKGGVHGRVLVGVPEDAIAVSRHGKARR